MTEISNDKAAVTGLPQQVPTTAIQPEGWLKEYLRRQESGLTGHPEESGFPFNTKMWAEELDADKREHNELGTDGWWPYEQTAYYLDGALRCGYLNRSEILINRVRANLRYILEHPKENARLGPQNIDDDSWAMVVFMRMAFEEYDNPHDPELLTPIENHYQAIYSNPQVFENIPLTEFNMRTILHIEHLCRLAELTNRERYITIAERLYQSFCDQAGPENPLTAIAMRSGKSPTGHGVTYHEFLKLPAVLFLYTRKRSYRETLEKAYAGLTKHQELADGLASCVEHFQGKRSDYAHETCNAVEFIWSTGWALHATGEPVYADKMEKVLFNAGFSAITKDFKAHQYYCAPNLFVSCDASNQWNDKDEWGYQVKGNLCYRPGHGTECCTGNIHRLLPCFLKRMWFIEDETLTVALYAPCRTEVTCPGGRTMQIIQETDYPFDNTVTFIFKTAYPAVLNFRMRVPGWSKKYCITLNGEIVKEGAENSCFTELKRTFQDNDEVTISFAAEPLVQDRGKGLAVNYGPLVFSLPVKAKITKTTDMGNGKCSEEYPAYQLYPLSEWRYALSKHLSPAKVELVRSDRDGYPWDHGNSPIILKVKARRLVRWDLPGHIITPDIPDDFALEDDEHTLQLVPMGATLLRITEFPQADF